MNLLIFLFILGILILVHEFGHFITARKLGVKIEKFSLGFGPQIFTKKKDNTEYTISAIPLGGYVKLAGDNLEEYKGGPDEYLAQSPGRRALIVFFGPLLNYVLGILCLWMVFIAGYPTLTTKVGGLLDGYGAKDAGIMAGDKIIAIDGKKIDDWEQLQEAIYVKKEATIVHVLLLRDNQELAVGVNIKEKNVDDPLGKKRNVGLLGIKPAEEIIKVKHGVFDAFLLSLKRTKDITFFTYKAIWRMCTGQISMRDSVAGPLGLFFITSQVARSGILALFNLTALLSIGLAIFNLLPLPVLDGGHIFLLGIEKIRGKNIGLKAERIISQAGFTLIISLALMITYNDIVRLFGDKIAKLFIH